MTPFGDRALRFGVPASIEARRALQARLRAVPGVRDVVLCETVGCAVFDVSPTRAETAALEAALTALPNSREPQFATEHADHEVRVIYDGEDLDEVARGIGRTRREVVEMHAGAEYRVAMLGFLPGFAYLRGLPSALILPRRAPRPRVPAGSVAIAAEYTGVYPVASAGGWHLIGRALDAPRLELGDRVRFRALDAGVEASGVDAGAVDASVNEERPPGRASSGAGPAPAWELRAPAGPHLVVTRVAGVAVFVDAGRPGQMHRGMPPGGPLVRSAFAAANARVGNASGACAIEVTGAIEVEARGGAVIVASATGASEVSVVRELAVVREGERLTVASGRRRVAYLAVGGGIDAPVVAGSRNVLLAAGIGRPLKRGDALGAGRSRADANASAVSNSARQEIAEEIVRVHAGPDLLDEVREAIDRETFTVSPTSDRAGTRLVGPALAVNGGTRASSPMVEGAIELTPSGLVVLGPDHPTTGGYPVVGVVASASRDAFFARPLGGRVELRFAP